MTHARTLEALLWLVTAAAAVWALLASNRMVPLVETATSEMSIPAPLPVTTSASMLSAAAGATIEKNPFRLERRPADVAYGFELAGTLLFELPEPEPPPPRPALAVAGILGGPPWEALIEGLPGRDGSVVVRTGDVLGDLRIRAIGRDLVVVEGADTTWRLTLKRAWQ